MNTTKRLRIKYLIALFSIISFFNACEVPNLNDSQYLPKITTSEVSEITGFSAISGGMITDDGGYGITARGVCWSSNPNPTIDDDKTEDGNGIGEFISEITNLESETKYYVRAYATYNQEVFYGAEINFITINTIADIEDNIYLTVKLGNQRWMAENLKATKYNDGTAIPYVTNDSQWSNLSTPAYCYYNYDKRLGFSVRCVQDK